MWLNGSVYVWHLFRLFLVLGSIPTSGFFNELLKTFNTLFQVFLTLSIYDTSVFYFPARNDIISRVSHACLQRK
jgi:hypothetical protein